MNIPLCYFLGFLVAISHALHPQFTLNGGVAQDKRGRLSVNTVCSVPMKIDSGWYSFAYGATNTLAYRSFSVTNSNLVIFRVQGNFCPNNFFAIFDNGQPIITSDTVPTGAGVLDCATNSSEFPWDSVDLPAIFGFGTAILLPGSHNLTIVATASYYGGGTAFVRVDSACTVIGSDPVPCTPSGLWPHVIMM